MLLAKRYSSAFWTEVRGSFFRTGALSSTSAMSWRICAFSCSVRFCSFRCPPCCPCCVLEPSAAIPRISRNRTALLCCLYATPGAGANLAVIQLPAQQRRLMVGRFHHYIRYMTAASGYTARAGLRRTSCTPLCWKCHEHQEPL